MPDYPLPGLAGAPNLESGKNLRLPPGDRLLLERLRHWKQGERNSDWGSKNIQMITPVVSIRPLHGVQSDLQYWLAKKPIRAHRRR